MTNNSFEFVKNSIKFWGDDLTTDELTEILNFVSAKIAEKAVPTTPEKTVAKATAKTTKKADAKASEDSKKVAPKKATATKKATAKAVESKVEKVEKPAKKTTKTTAKAVASAKKEYGTPAFHLDKKYVTYTNADGSYLSHSGIRQVLNTRIKNDFGGVYNKTLRVWEFKTITAAKKCVNEINRVVTEADLKPVFEKWASK